MKVGRTLNELAAELTNVRNTKRDFVAPAPALQMVVRERDNKPVMKLSDNQYVPTAYASGQLAQFLDIPKAYYDRMATDVPELLARNVNTWLARHPSDKRMIRTVGDTFRAFLSDRFRPLDNYDLAEVAIPVLRDNGAQVESCELTETRLYIKATFPNVTRTINGSRMRDLATPDQITDYAARTAYNKESGYQIGDIVSAMLCLSNSEVGAGTLKIETGAMRLACFNAMLSPDRSFKKYHIGKSNAAIEDDRIRELLSTEARRADDQALWLKVRDVMRASCNQDRFAETCGKLEAATGDKIGAQAKLEQVVELATDYFGLPDAVNGSILNHLIEGGDLSRYGLTQAITRASADVDDYDLATDMERAGGMVIELPQKDWKSIAMSATA